MPSVHSLAGLVGRARRVPRTGYSQLTSKRSAIKGRGVPSVGRKTTKGAAGAARQMPCVQYDDPAAGAGAFLLLKERLPNFVVPDLTGFKARGVWP